MQQHVVAPVFLCRQGLLTHDRTTNGMQGTSSQIQVKKYICTVYATNTDTMKQKTIWHIQHGHCSDATIKIVLPFTSLIFAWLRHSEMVVVDLKHTTYHLGELIDWVDSWKVAERPEAKSWIATDEQVVTRQPLPSVCECECEWMNEVTLYSTLSGANGERHDINPHQKI